MALAAALVGAIGAFSILAATPLTAAAVEPIDMRDEHVRPQPSSDPEAVARLLRKVSLSSSRRSAPRPTPAPDRTAGPTRTPRPTQRPTPTPSPTPPGYDISYPQCGSAYPDTFSFAIVGVNGGRVYSENPCLGPSGDPSQLRWAGRDAELYANTGNPGPDISSYWPHGQTEPRACDTDDLPGADTPDCAYVYGWNAAEHAYVAALDAYIDLDWTDADAERIPDDPTWWLDVEDANSWRNDRSLNVAALQGAADYLESVGAEVGFYSTPRLWNRVTGGTEAFASHPSWHAGARNEADAKRRCSDVAFTGGDLRMVQWIEDGLDANYRCP
ncbi:MAG: hypothetical protein H0W41_04780 [Chloroflexi bacterium]|nr:hypothetical protein [Chloroflexota bacterium]